MLGLDEPSRASAHRRRATPAVAGVAGAMLCAAVPSRRSPRSAVFPPPAVGQMPGSGERGCRKGV